MSVVAVEYDGLLDELAESERAVRFAQACQLHALAKLAKAKFPDPLTPAKLDKHWVREDVACALRVSPDSAGMRLAMASDADEHYPELVKLLESGQVSLAHYLAFADAANALAPEQKRALYELVADRAPGQAITTFRRAVKKALLTVRPVEIETNRKALVEQRHIRISHGEDGMSQFLADLPTQDAVALAAAIENLAQHWSRQPDEARTLDQLRVDAFTHLVSGAQPGEAKLGVNVCVALSTLTGADDQPAELTADGIPAALGGSIVAIGASQARQLAFGPETTWRRLITDDHGALLDYGRTTYRPPAPLARFVKARDRQCRFPHCTRPAMRCELDHRHDWELGGTTCPDNLDCLCLRHHHLKHDTPWTVRKLADGTTRWTNPTGRHYDKPPEHYPQDHTTNTEDDPPPPF